MNDAIREQWPRRSLPIEVKAALFLAHLAHRLVRGAWPQVDEIDRQLREMDRA